MEIPKYIINHYRYCFKHPEITSLFRYVCEDEFYETLTYGVIRLKKPLIWKENYPDELYLYEWISKKDNAGLLFDIALDKLKCTVNLLSPYSQPDLKIQLSWLTIYLLNYIDILSLNIPNERFAACFTQNRFERDMWKNYSTNDHFICYEISSDYFQKIALKTDITPQELFHGSYSDLWKMNYCSPEECVDEFVKDTKNSDKINNAIYLKNKALATEDEVRLTYIIPESEEIRDYKSNYRIALEDQLREQDDITLMKSIFLNGMMKYHDSYLNYLKNNKSKATPILFENQLYLKLQGNINQYIISVRTAPNAPKEYVNIIKETCEKLNIKFTT